MAQLIVGDPGCTFQELVPMFDDPSLFKLKMTWWSSIATRLDTPLHLVKKWQQDLLLEKLTHVDVIILEMLKQWRMRKSNDATLGALYEAIPNEMKRIRDFLQEKIRKEAKFWTNLDKDSQNIVMQTNVKFLGRTYSLSKLRDMMNAAKFNEILRNTEMKKWFLKSFQDEEWDLGNCQIPKPLPYYINRKFELKRKLNPTIFKHECSDIFLIEGIQHHHLSILARPHLTDVSSDQVDQVTRRFILLEHPDDYDEIIRIADDPVHRIKHEDNQFYWQSTSGSCQTIRVYLYTDAEEIDESILVKDQFSMFNNRPIAICSCPGMGKSILLANLAREMIQIYSDRIILYLEFYSIIPKLSSLISKIDSENMNQVLVTLTSFNNVGKDILLGILQNENLVVEIFLDGFDEISVECLEKAKSFLKCLLGSANKRLYITSRQHMQNELENTLDVISLDIAPFNQVDQVNFFCSYWIMDQGLLNLEKLTQFALKVLESLKFINQDMTSRTEFTGIPLQCFMLAQVHANHAKIHCNRDNFNFRATKSLSDLYNAFMKLKFKSIEKSDRNLIKMYHMKEALTLLFADNHEAIHLVKELTRKFETENVCWKKIFSVGILEQAGDKPNFVHRTFAEYMLAEFIVEDLLIKQFVDNNTSARFVLESVLCVHETTRGQIISAQDISDISKVIVSSESWLTGKLNPEKLKTILLSQCELTIERVQDDVVQILYNWLQQMGSNATFDILDSALEFLDCSQIVDELHENYFEGNFVLQHEMLCTFVDTFIGKYENLLTVKTPQYCEDIGGYYTEEEWDQVKWKLLICIAHGYEYLTQTLMSFFRDTPLFVVLLNMEPKLCKELLMRASHNDNVEFYKYICDIIKSFTEFDFIDFYRMFICKDILFECTPLCEPISRGNYKLVEYLINTVGQDVKDLNYMWLACFFKSWSGSPNVVKNKVKILKLLKNLNHDFSIERLKNNFPNGVNLVLLTTLYDLIDYIPTESDAEFLAVSVAHCCRLDDEMDNLVNWLLSKNLAHFLFLHDQDDNCLLDYALLKNFLKPQTLQMVYMKYNFDLGMIYKSAVGSKRSEAIVNKIVSLSGDVNLADKNKNTLMHWAAFYRKLNVTKYLLSVGANVNFRNVYDYTPLHYVFLNGQSSQSFHMLFDIVSMLVSNKADVCAENIAGISALQLANANRDEMSIEEKTLDLMGNSEPCNTIEKTYLTKKISTITSKSCGFAYMSECFYEWVWNIVHISRNMDLSDNNNATLLHYAALFGESKTMEYLLSCGVNANCKDNDGDTPLHYIFDLDKRNSREYLISLNRNTEWIKVCVQILLKYYADVSVKNNREETPLDMAQRQKDNLNIEDSLISLLEERFELENEID